MLRKRRFPKTRHIIKHCKRSVERLKKNKNLIDKVISNNVIAEGSYKTYNKYHVAKCNENFFYIYNSFFNDDMNIGKPVNELN